MTLTDKEEQEIEKALAHLPTKRAGCTDALRIVQKHRGWVPDDAIDALSSVLGMTPADVDSIATFYSLIFRKPVGKHVIMVCDSVSCWVMGGESVMSCLRRKLEIEPGQSTSDGLFTLLPSACLGHCEQAPVMMIDEEVFGNLTEEKIDHILARLRTQDREL